MKIGKLEGTEQEFIEFFKLTGLNFDEYVLHKKNELREKISTITFISIISIFIYIMLYIYIL